MVIHFRGQAAKIIFLVKHGADVNAKDIDLRTPAHFAVLNPYNGKQVIDVLDSLNASLSEVDVVMQCTKYCLTILVWQNAIVLS